MKLQITVQFHFNLFVELLFVFGDPGRQGLLYDNPGISLFMHIKNNPVATVIHGIYGKYLFLQLAKFSEIEFAQTASGLDQPCEVYYFGEMYLHKLPRLNIYYCNYCAISAQLLEKLFTKMLIDQHRVSCYTNAK
jgi:hypothetical protein